MNRAMRRAAKSKNPNPKSVGSNFSSKNDKLLIDHKAATANVSTWQSYNKDKLEETA